MFKRKFLKIIVMMFIFILIIGCSDQSYEEYKNAYNKTENLESGKFSIDVQYELNFNREKLSAEDFEKVSQFSNLKFAGVSVYDDSKNALNFYGNLEGGNIGLDFEYYGNDTNKYLKIPIIGKYIDLNNFDMDKLSEKVSLNTEALKNNFDINISKEAFTAIDNLWEEGIQDENVFKGEKSLLETPDGDVKVTEYTIELSDEALKRLVKETMEILELSDQVAVMEEMTIDDFKYIAYVDVDDFIIQENFLMNYTLVDMPEVESGMFKYEITNYDINKGQDVEMPAIDKSMLLDLDKINDITSQFEGLNKGENDE